MSPNSLVSHMWFHLPRLQVNANLDVKKTMAPLWQAVSDILHVLPCFVKNEPDERFCDMWLVDQEYVFCFPNLLSWSLNVYVSHLPSDFSSMSGLVPWNLRFGILLALVGLPPCLVECTAFALGLRSNAEPCVAAVTVNSNMQPCQPLRGVCFHIFLKTLPHSQHSYVINFEKTLVKQRAGGWPAKTFLDEAAEDLLCVCGLVTFLHGSIFVDQSYPWC